MNKLEIHKDLVPKAAIETVETLKNGGFEAFLVGGCVRDLFIGRTPKDWDVTTNAKPEDIIRLFPKTFYENDYGTVGVVFENKEDASTTPLIIEVTPYRTESDYTNGRHPDSVSFGDNLEEDLKRRDFTINAMAYDPKDNKLIDPYKGQKDIELSIIQCVGDAKERFNEDGLRILRAVRLATELSFMINTDTEKSLIDSREMLKKISKERIRDEFTKIMMSRSPMVGVFMCQKYGILGYIVPELEEGVHMKQNQAHSYDVFEHLLRSLQCAADKDYSLEIRLAALFHDIGKPKSRRYSAEKGDYTFYGHDVIGADMAKKALERLVYPKKTVEEVVKLVRWHMFFSDTEQITHSAVRRMIANVGRERIWDLMNLRVCDRVGTGRPKENPYRLRKYTAMIEEVLMDPISVGMLKINGQDLIKLLNITPGPIIGHILNALLEEVIEDPKLNTKEFLEKHSLDLAKLPAQELIEKAEGGKKAREIKEKEEVEKIRDKYYVK